MTKPPIEPITDTHHGDPRRAGFTIIELLTVVAVISILVALLLPAIQSSREQARRLQCTNNLLQISLAIHNYAASHRVFPPGVVESQGPIDNRPRGYHMGWSVQILPFLEQRNIWNQFNFRFGVHDACNTTAQQRSVNTFMCPSDGRATGRNGMSYAGCYHDTESPIAADNQGVLYLNSRISLDDIGDGPAHTILVGEFQRTGPDRSWARGTRATLRNTGHRPNSAAALYNPPSLEPVENQPDFNPTQPEVANVNQEESRDDGLALWFVGGFSSHHPGGANFLFCDGSVRFLKQKLAPSLFRALGNRSDGLLISDDQF